MFRIRNAVWSDCANLAKVQVDNYRLNYTGLLPQSYLDQFSYEEQEQDWKDWMTTHSEDILVVAEKNDGELVGYAQGKSGLTSIPPYDSELTALHVSPTWQMLGIGRQLMQAVASRFVQMGCLSMMLWVMDKNKARLFYERLGGQIIGKQILRPGKEDIQFVEIAYGWPDINKLVALRVS
ncbi:MAG: GNAT family N-acetyltransferase [Anaerolineaceae bacterium]